MEGEEAAAGAVGRYLLSVLAVAARQVEAPVESSSRHPAHQWKPLAVLESRNELFVLGQVLLLAIASLQVKTVIDI